MHTQRQQGLGNRSTRNVWVLGITLVLLAACQGANPRDRPWREPVPIKIAEASDSANVVGPKTHTEPRTLRIHLNADPGSLDPAHEPSLWALRIMMDNVVETLVRYQPSDGTAARYQPSLARSWNVSPGGREIRITLNEKARWQGGTPVSTLDVRASLSVAMSKQGAHREALADVMAVELLGKNQLRLRLRKPNAFVLRELALVPILPASTRSPDANSPWIGSGPYRVTREGDDVLLTRDPDYWATGPAIDKIVFVRHQDSALALREAEQGTMDIVSELIREHYPEQLDVPFVSQNFSILRLAPADVSYLVFNAARHPFSDGTMRRAVAHLLDRQTLSDMAGGLSKRVSGLIWPGGPGNGAAPPIPSFSPEEAATLLDQVGWRDDDGDGIRSREEQRLTIVVLKTETTHEVRDAALVALAKAGFVVEPRVAEAADLQQHLQKGEFDLAFLHWRGATERDLSILLASGGAKNYGGYRSPVVDELLASIRTTSNPKRRRALLTNLARLLGRSMPLVAVHAPEPRGIVHKRVLGLSVWNGWFSIRDLRLKRSE